MKRREFVLKSSLLTTSILAPMSLSSCNNLPSKNKVGIQLYSLRDEMIKNPKETLAKVASFGYKYIEGYEGDLGLFWGMSNIEFKKYLDTLGLKMIASHCGDTNNLESFKTKCDQAAEVGIDYLICPWADGERSIAGFQQIAETFNKCGQIAKESGIKFAYHNHDYSFKKIEGIYLQDILMSGTDKNLVDFEMDIYWVVASGEDPKLWFDKYPGRFTHSHVKDYKELPNNKYESCTLGRGSIDFPSILAYGKEKGLKFFIVEQEAYTGTSQLESAKDNYNYMSALKV
jgi:sugar phosphate isomerase/epimerase